MATEGKTIQEKLEAHPVYIYGTVFVLSLSTGFGLGYGAREIVYNISDSKAVKDQPKGNTSETLSKNAPQGIEGSGQSTSEGNNPPGGANPNTPISYPAPTDADKPVENTAHAVNFKPIIKEEDPLSITLKMVNLKKNRLECIFDVRNTESKSIKVGLGFSGKTKVFMDGAIYTPSRFELAGKKYSKNDLILEELPGGETLSAKIIFEEVPEGSKPSTLETDYYALGDSYQSSTQIFKLL